MFHEARICTLIEGSLSILETVNCMMCLSSVSNRCIGTQSRYWRRKLWARSSWITAILRQTYFSSQPVLQLKTFSQHWVSSRNAWIMTGLQSCAMKLWRDKVRLICLWRGAMLFSHLNLCKSCFVCWLLMWGILHQQLSRRKVRYPSSTSLLWGMPSSQMVNVGKPS